MPYIQQLARSELRTTQRQPKTAGEFNYLVTKMAIAYFQTQGSNYQAINDVIGALEGAKLEFYRRLVSGYEDTKVKENGDVYK